MAGGGRAITLDPNGQTLAYPSKAAPKNPSPRKRREAVDLFRKDPRREIKRAIADAVICRECGAWRKSLQSHLRSVHGLNTESYRRKWSDSDGNLPPIVSSNVVHHLRLPRKKRVSRPGWSASRGKEAEFRIWPAVCLARQGLPHDQIGEKINRHATSIRSALIVVGMGGRPCYRDLGDPVTARFLLDLRDATGLSLEKLSLLTGTTLTTSRSGSAPGSANIYSWKKGSRRIRREIAQKVIDWRDRVLQSFAKGIGKSASDHHERNLDRPALLKTLIPGLREKRVLLLAILRRLREFVVDQGIDSERLQDFLCDRAKEGRSRGRANDPFTNFLPWAPQLMPLIEARLGQIGRKGASLWDIAGQLIGERWNMTEAIANRAAVRSTPTTGPSEMRGLILLREFAWSKRAEQASFAAPLAVERASAAARKRPGPAPLSYDKTESFRVGRMVQDVFPRFENLCRDLGQLPRRARTKPSRAQVLLAPGKYTEDEIKAAARTPSSALRAARQFITQTKTAHAYDTVAEYHREFLRAVAQSQLR